MHEVSVVQHLFGITRRKMKEEIGREVPVKKIKVVIGKLNTVVPSAFEFAFEAVSKGTIFEGAEMVVDYVPLKIRCEDCGGEMIIDEPFMFCRKCDSFDVKTVSGEELLVESFEIADQPGKIGDIA